MAIQTQIRGIMRTVAPSGPKNYSPAPQWINPQSDRYRAILRDLQVGTSFYRTARNHAICVNTARRIAHRHGITRDDPKTHAAAEARRSYAREERVRLLDLAFERLEALLEDVDDAKSLQQLCAAMATLIDRRRLEDAERTRRTEVVQRESARSILAAKVEDLAARCRTLPPEDVSPSRGV